MTGMYQVHRDTVFQSLPRPTVLLDTDFVIRAVNVAYLAATGRSADELVDVHMFDAFPDNPEDPDADGVANLNRSLERAASSRRPHDMLVQRYDIADTTHGTWALRHWSPLNTPVLDDNQVVALLHQVDVVTTLGDGQQRVMERYRDLMEGGSLSDADARTLADAAQAFARSADEHRAISAEVMHLRRALTSRATIDQAKGIIMAEHRCSPEAAFDVLARLASEANVRLADVASALVYRTQGATTKG